MKLVGLLDSPFVRRTFISARMLGIPFEHQSLSVFRNLAEFHAITPLLKAPTLVLDDGELMVDSTQIITWFERIAPAGKSLMPADEAAFRRCLQFVGYGLAAAEKSVTRYYETQVRPEDARYPAWIERATGQIRDTYALIDRQVGDTDWLRFTRFSAPGLVDDSDYPHLAALATRAEALPAFKAADFS